jgi:hypothetical protein
MRRRDFIRRGALFVPATFGIFVPRLRSAPPLFLAQNAGAAVSSGFDPSAYGSPTVWYAARKESFADADAVGTWTDWTGNGFHATQATSGSKPEFKTNQVGGLPALRFNGSKHLDASFTGSATTTSFFVWRSVSSAGYARLTSSSNDAGNTDALYGIGTEGVTLYSGAVLRAAFTTSSFFVLTAVHNGASSAIYNSGALAVSGNVGSTVPASAWRLGRLYSSATHFLDGYWAEHLVYNSILSTGNRQAVEDALGAIYGLTITH